jgi:hypothetical protein
MSKDREPDRLIDTLGAPGELRLALRAAREAGPDTRELELLAERMNLSKGPTIPSPPALTPAIRGTSLAKGAAVLALVTSGLLLGLAWRSSSLNRGTPRVETLVPAAPVISTSTSVEAAARPQDPIAEPSVVEIQPPFSEKAVTTTPPSPPRRPLPRDPHTPAIDADGDEARLLTEARAELKGDPSRALGLAEEHGRRFANGQLQEEREVIAIAALVGLGRVEEATLRWERFHARFARSAYTARLSALFAPEGSPKSTEKTGAPSPLTP